MNGTKLEGELGAQPYKFEPGNESGFRSACMIESGARVHGHADGMIPIGPVGWDCIGH